MAKAVSKSLTVVREDKEDNQILGIVMKGSNGEIYFKVARKITLTMKDMKEIVIIMNKLYAEEE